MTDSWTFWTPERKAEFAEMLADLNEGKKMNAESNEAGVAAGVLIGLLANSWVAMVLIGILKSWGWLDDTWSYSETLVTCTVALILVFLWKALRS